MIKVRDGFKNDFSKVYQIECVVFKHPWGMFDFYEDFINNPRSRWFVAEDEGEIVGFGGFWLGVDEIHIVNLAVLPECRNMGIGRSIVSKMMDEAEKDNFKTVLLEVRESNKPARNLYKGFGFRELYIRKKYY